MYGECKYCHCTEHNPCLRSASTADWMDVSKTCSWIDETQTCCTAPNCVILFVADWPTTTLVTL